MTLDLAVIRALCEAATPEIGSGDVRQRAKAPECDGYLGERCGSEAVVFNAYSFNGEDGGSEVWCDACCDEAKHHWVDFKRTDDARFDRYEPLILAYVGDCVWIALECAFRILAGDDRIHFGVMTEAQQWVYNDSIPAMLVADGYTTKMEPHGPSAAMWPRRAA